MAEGYNKDGSWVSNGLSAFGAQYLPNQGRSRTNPYADIQGGVQPWQVGMQAPQQASQGGVMGMLGGFLNNAPATPQYGTPNTPQLPAMPQMQSPGALPTYQGMPSPGTLQGQSLSTPQFQSPGDIQNTRMERPTSMYSGSGGTPQPAPAWSFGSQTGMGASDFNAIDSPYLSSNKNPYIDYQGQREIAREQSRASGFGASTRRAGELANGARMETVRGLGDDQASAVLQKAMGGQQMSPYELSVLQSKLLPALKYNGAEEANQGLMDMLRAGGASYSKDLATGEYSPTGDSAMGTYQQNPNGYDPRALATSLTSLLEGSQGGLRDTFMKDFGWKGTVGGPQQQQPQGMAQLGVPQRQLSSPQQPQAGPINFPQPNSGGALNTPGPLQGRDFGWKGTVGGPPLSSPPQQQAGPIDFPQPNSGGALNTPGPLQGAALQPGASLEYINDNLMGYAPTDYSMFDLGQASPINVPSQPPQQPGQIANNLRITSGVTPPPTPSAPVTPAAGGIPGLGRYGGAALGGGFGQGVQSPMMQQRGQHAQQASQLGLAGQQAQSQSGLGWGSLGQQQQQANQRYKVGQQGNTLGFIGGMSRMLG